VHYPPLGAGGKVIGNDQTQASSSRSHLAESTSFGIAKERERAATEGAKEDNSGRDDSSKDSPKKHEDVPLSFYPNYQSLYYEPYIYTYSGFNPHFVPGTYYVDYQPYGAVEPIPAITPRSADSGHLLPSFHDEKRDRTKSDKEKIPDVPPPPLPTSSPKRS